MTIGTKISNLPAGGDALSTDRLPVARSPFLSGDNVYLSVGDIESFVSVQAGYVSVVALGADPTGINDSTTAFNDANALGVIGVVPAGDYYLASTPSVTGSAWLVSPLATFTGAGAAGGVFHTTRGLYSNLANGVDIWKTTDRVFVGAAIDNDGSSVGASSRTYIADAGVGYFHERSAQSMSLATNGNTGYLGATQKSTRYTLVYGAGSVWVSGASAALNAKIWYGGRIYNTTVAGVFGVTPPVHTAGSATNGTATLQFLDFAYTTPIGVSGLALSDLGPDGSAAWASYFQGFRFASCGTVYAGEVGAPNFGNNVINTPYNVAPNGSTIGWWMPGGYDASIKPSINPSTAAIVIGAGDNSWNKGIVFGATSITGTDGVTGQGEAICFAHGHGIYQNTPNDQLGSFISMEVNSVAHRVSMRTINDEFQFDGVGGRMAVVRNGTAGTSETNIALVGYATSDGYAEVKAEGVTLSANLRLNTSGTGTHVEICVNDGAALATADADKIALTVPQKLPTFIVSGLPAAGTIGSGGRAFVTDATQTLAAGIGTVVAGTGANFVPVYSDGANWRIG